MLKTILAMTLCVMALSGCAGGKFDLFKTAETAVHLKLLDAEFDGAVATIRSYPLNAQESIQMNQRIAEAQVQREFIRTLHKQNGGRIAMASIQAQQHLDDITKTVRGGRDVFLAHLRRTKKPVPAALESTYKSAVVAREHIQGAIDSGVGVSGVDMAQYLMLALRTIAAFQGVPIAQEEPPDNPINVLS